MIGAPGRLSRWPTMKPPMVTIVKPVVGVWVIAGWMLVPFALLAQGAQPNNPTERRVPFAADEQLSYDVSWSSCLTAGSATLTVREKKPSSGSTAYYIVGEARPNRLLSTLYTLYYKADVLLERTWNEYLDFASLREEALRDLARRVRRD